MWRLFVIYHQYIQPEFHQLDPHFNKKNVQLIQTSGYRDFNPEDYTSKGYVTHRESDFEYYDPSLQKKKYFAPSVLYHVFKNAWYPAEYIGFLEYDFELRVSTRDAQKMGIKTNFGPSVCKFIENNLKKNRIIALSTRWRLQELVKHWDIKVGDTHWFAYFVVEYNKYLETLGSTQRVSREALLKENPVIPTQQSFICDIESFKKVMGFIAYLIDNSRLGDSRPAPATILERYIGLSIHLCDSEVIYLSLQHRAHHGYRL